jgi:hypothetical protein
MEGRTAARAGASAADVVQQGGECEGEEVGAIIATQPF